MSLRSSVFLARTVFLVFLFAVMLFSTIPAWGLGSTEESAFQDATGIRNWSHDIPVEDLEPGTYNLLVRATDRAGNAALAEPVDIIIDPESDIPTAAISTPTSNAVVGSRLLVLGTAGDDDSVAEVRVRVNEEQEQVAVGREFWSASFNVADLDEGLHTITAWATDENGLESARTSVPFQLDLSGPDVAVEGVEAGSLVSGRVTLEGSVTDGNGLESLALQYGDDGGTESLRVRNGRVEQSFSHRFDTRDFDDGPLVLWFTARDAVGQTTRFPFLLFIDNTAPELTIREPGEEAVPAGRVRVTGLAQDALGIAALEYETRSGGEGELEVRPGDPFWEVDLDLSDAGRREVFTIQATDEAGNTTTRRRRVSLDRDADLPRIRAHQVGTEFISGSAHDDDGVQAVEYRIDRGEWTRAQTARSFAIPTPGLDPGEYSVSLRAVDVHGRLGPEVDGDLRIPPTRPLFAELHLLDSEGIRDEPFYPGQVVYEGEARRLLGKVTGARGVGRVQYRFDGAAEWSRTRLRVDEETGIGTFELRLGRRQDPGRHTLELRVENEIGEGDRSRRFYYLLQREPEEPDPEETYLTEIPDAAGLYLVDGRWDRSGGVISLRNERPVRAFVAGAEIARAQLEPETDAFEVTVDPESEGRLADRVVRIEPREQARAEAVRLVVETAEGERFESESFDLLYDTEAPEIDIAGPATDSWHNQAVEVQFTVRETVGDPVVEYAIGEESFAELAPVATADDGAGADDDGSGANTDGAERRYRFTLGPPTEDGGLTAYLRARDTAGNTAFEAIRVNFDTTAPTVSYVSPAEDEAVNGRVTIVGTVEDASPLASLGRRRGGGEPDDAAGDAGGDGEAGGDSEVGDGEAGALERLELADDFSFSVDLTQYVDTTARPTVVAEDRAGNVAEVAARFPIEAGADRPEVSIQLPPDGSVRREDFVVSGTVFDDDGVAEVLAKIDDGGYRPVSSGNSFSIPIDVQELGDNEHSVTVKAVDLGGVESVEQSLSFSISLNPPDGEVVTPGLAAPVREQIVIGGTAGDANGIRSVALSFDNGSTFHSARADEPGFAEWSYPLNTETLTDGLHAVQVRLIDELGTETLFSSLLTVDNTPPEVVLDLPTDGAVVTDTLTISGRVRDGQRLADAELRATPRSSSGIDPLSLEIRPGPGGVVREEINVSDVPPGAYDVELVARDESANRGSASRNIVVQVPDEELERIEVFTPFEGARRHGVLDVEGRVVSDRDVPSVTVGLDGISVGIAEVNADGFFSLPVAAPGTGGDGMGTSGAGAEQPGPDGEGVNQTQAAARDLEPGSYELVVTANTGAEGLQSSPRRFSYATMGPWVQVDTHRSGDSVGSRPLLSGSAGYSYEEPQGLEEGSREYRRALREFEITRVDVSLDNGATFERASGEGSWEYRLETAQLSDGRRPILVRATARNGKQAYRRIHLRIDTSPPEVQVDLPQESGRFNDLISAGGSAEDEHAVEEVAVVLREGSKNRYEVPEFIQGLYADAHFLGASSWDIGLGLTFFDDNVKLQGQIGSAPPGRFSGLVLGGKLLANVARLPFSSFLGPDFSFLSGSAAVGANFSYFTMSEDRIGFTEEGLVLGGVVGQVEFPIFQVESWRAFNAYSFYTEGQLWFISSDIQGGVETKLSFGVRVQLL